MQLPICILSCRELNRIPNPWEKKKIEKKHTLKKKKTITRTRQYLRGSAICLYPRSCRDFTIIKEEENTRCGYNYSSQKKKKTRQPTHKKNPNQSRFLLYKMGQKNFGPFLYENRLWVIRVLLWVVLPCFRVREKYCSHILYSVFFLDNSEIPATLWT